MTSRDSMPMQVEGDYIGAKKFHTEETEFAKTGPVEKKAKETREHLDGA